MSFYKFTNRRLRWFYLIVIPILDIIWVWTTPADPWLFKISNGIAFVLFTYFWICAVKS